MVDDFYEDPDGVRGEALQMNYQKASYVPYPGVISEKRDRRYRATGRKIGSYINAQDKNLIGGIQAFGEFRITLANDHPSFFAHSHGLWTGLISLTPHWLENDMHSLFLQPRNVECNPLVKDHWTVTERISLRYNRLLLFDSRMYHSFSPGFGTDRETGRLTQNFDMIDLGKNASQQSVRSFIARYSKGIPAGMRPTRV
jgi:hypothetical protein